MRKLIANILAPAMRAAGYRFPKYHRQNATLIYRLIDVVHANVKAAR